MKRPFTERPNFVITLIAVQSLCAVIFLWDVTEDGLAAMVTGLLDMHLNVEAVAVVAMIAAIIFEVRVLMRLLQRQAHLERQVSLAARAFHDVLNERFSDWSLTTAERDVAHFTVKGLSIADIARMRGSADGTVKSQLNAIYRKAGVGNRGEFLSLLIEEVMDHDTPADAGGQARPEKSG